MFNASFSSVQESYLNAGFSKQYNTYVNSGFSVPYISNFNSASSIREYTSYFNISNGSFGPQPITLSTVTNKDNNFSCVIDNIPIQMTQFYFHRQKNFLTTLVIELAKDVWDLVKDKQESTISVYWESHSIIVELVSSTLKELSYIEVANRKTIKLHARKYKKEVEQRILYLDQVISTREINNIVKQIKTFPQPYIAPEDILIYKGTSYIIKSVKTTVNNTKSFMDVYLYG